MICKIEIFRGASLNLLFTCRKHSYSITMPATSLTIGFDLGHKLRINQKKLGRVFFVHQCDPLDIQRSHKLNITNKSFHHLPSTFLIVLLCMTFYRLKSYKTNISHHPNRMNWLILVSHRQQFLIF